MNDELFHGTSYCFWYELFCHIRNLKEVHGGGLEHSDCLFSAPAIQLIHHTCLNV